MDMELDEPDRRLEDEETKGIVVAGFGNVSTSSSPFPLRRSDTVSRYLTDRALSTLRPVLRRVYGLLGSRQPLKYQLGTKCL